MVLPSRVFVMVTLTLQVSAAEQMAWPFSTMVTPSLTLQSESESSPNSILSLIHI